MAADASRTQAQVRRIKKLGYYANYALTTVVAALLLVGVVVWAWEEVARANMHLARLWIPDPKLREARLVLLIGYLLTLAFLCMIQCCIQIAKDPHHQHIGPRRMVWTLAATLMVLVFVAAAALAAAYRSKVLGGLNATMSANLSGPYYTGRGEEDFSGTGKVFNEVQSKARCCGVEGRQDYAEGFAAPYNMYNLSVPYSCCRLKSGVSAGSVITRDDVEDVNACQNEPDSDHAYTTGCHDALYDVTSAMCREITIIAIVAAVVIVVVAALRLSLGWVYQRGKKRQAQYDTVHTVAMTEVKDGQASSSNAEKASV